MIIRLIDLILEDSAAAKQAKSMRLTSMGFGNWGKDGKVTHRTDKGKLIQIDPRTSKATSTSRQSPEVPSSPKPQPSKARIPSVPTKKNPSFDELRKEARKHTFTVMTKTPLEGVRSVEQTGQRSAIGKPEGFWFGVGAEWIDWTEDEMPEWKGDNLYSVEVDESACLTIETEFDLREFNRTYGTRDGMIDWQRVAKDHKGIIFKQYFPSARMKYRWYYSWDVASGCVWDASAIKQVEQQPITQTSPEAQSKPIPFEEFERTIPKFTEEDEAIADRDEEAGSTAIFGTDNYEEVVETIEKWKWGGEEGKGAWGFDATERQRIFDTVNKTIRDTNATVEAPRLHRGISFGSGEDAQRFIAQFKPGESVELPPCGWSPNSEISMAYGPNDPSEPEISAMIELEAGDSPIRGLSTTSVERNIGMEIIQHEVITPGDVKYEVKEIKQHTITKNGRTQTVYKVILKQANYTNESTAAQIKKYSMLAYMGGSLGMARNIRKNYKRMKK